MKRSLKSALAVMLCFGALAAASTLGACSFSKAHQVVPSGKACTSCHEEKQTYDVTSPKGALCSGGTVSLKTAASSVSVCTPVFTSEDGSSYTPQERRTVSVEDGQAVIQLDEGVWALCVKKDDTSVGQIVVVSSESTDSPTVTL